MDTQSSSQLSIAERLRPLRKQLVLAAEAVLGNEASHLVKYKRAGKSQLHRLAAVCSQASCAEEITNYLRYQSSRDSGGERFWDPDAVDAVIQRFAGIETVPAEDDVRVAAWQLYAVYLMRAFTYETEKRDSKNHTTKRNNRNATSSKGKNRG
ncbi:hypothetical protein [Haliangium ochraceum]|uniref:CRISPR type III-B/RAMP module-associated protein Cmr5 n=1 Tax=Haliangium ochraceum (strain DSM 14365 / JCM 11303 / SMP-2) TaxID=502025 RepID=D0LG42_HALO1|nr:hypothetical protein [Haliangium ochraceum]ACY18067.1 hypothetical protein Hoch_5585 [Haliangium ochraceum DSM 14365]